MVLGKLSAPERLTRLDNSRTRAFALAVGAGGGCLDIFFLVYHFSSFSLSLGDGPTEILSERAVKPQNNQPTNNRKLQSLSLLKTGG